MLQTRADRRAHAGAAPRVTDAVDRRLPAPSPRVASSCRRDAAPRHTRLYQPSRLEPAPAGRISWRRVSFICKARAPALRVPPSSIPGRKLPREEYDTSWRPAEDREIAGRPPRDGSATGRHQDDATPALGAVHGSQHTNGSRSSELREPRRRRRGLQYRVGAPGTKVNSTTWTSPCSPKTPLANCK